MITSQTSFDWSFHTQLFLKKTNKLRVEFHIIIEVLIVELPECYIGPNLNVMVVAQENLPL